MTDPHNHVSADICDALRRGGQDDEHWFTIGKEAADEIERLRGDLRAYEITLKRIAEEDAKTGDDAQAVEVWGPTQEDIVAKAIMLDDGCGLTINGQRTLCDDPRAMEKPDRCYCRRSAKAALSALASRPQCSAASEPVAYLHQCRDSVAEPQLGFEVARNPQWTSEPLYRAVPQTASGERLYTLKEATTALEQALQTLSLTRPHLGRGE